MSLEKRRDTKDSDKKKILDESTFRQTDFTPLQKREPKKEESETVLIEGDLKEIEQDVLDIAKDILKLKRYEAEFEIEDGAAQIQKYPIIEKLYAKLNLEFTSQEGYQFSDYIQELRETTL